MSLKTKDRCGKLGNDVGMSMKTKDHPFAAGNKAVMFYKTNVVTH
jgi:hypothetical protein